MPICTAPAAISFRPVPLPLAVTVVCVPLTVSNEVLAELKSGASADEPSMASFWPERPSVLVAVPVVLTLLVMSAAVTLQAVADGVLVAVPLVVGVPHAARATVEAT